MRHSNPITASTHRTYHVTGLEHGGDVAERDQGVNVAVVHLEQVVQARVVRRLRVLVHKDDTVHEVVVRRVRWEVRVVVHVDLLVGVLDDIEIVLARAADADKDAARAVGGLDAVDSSLNWHQRDATSDA